MRNKKFIISMLIISATATTFAAHKAEAIISAQISVPNVSVSINGYVPAPVGVYILHDSGRPYYVERDRRIYLKERPAKHHHKKKHHKDRGHKHGHD